MAKAVVSTKEQERKALEQIKKIVDDLGADSYIGMAFEGCFEIAEENIANDFGCSMKQRAESAEKKCDELRQLNAGLEKRNTELEQEVFNERDRANQSLEDAKNREEERDASIDRENEKEAEILELEAEIKNQEIEIIMLKAKLYDLLVKE